VAAVGQRAEGVAQPLVARQPEAGDFAFAGFDRDGRLSGIAGERVADWVAPEERSCDRLSRIANSLIAARTSRARRAAGSLAPTGSP